MTERCQEQIYKGWHTHICGRPVKRNGMCGIHARAAEERAEKDVIRTQERKLSTSRKDEATKIIERLASHGIAGRHVYNGAMHTGEVAIDTHDLESLIGGYEEHEQ